MPRFVRALPALALCFATAANAQLGGLLDKARQSASDAVERKTQDAASGAVDKATSLPTKKDAPAPSATAGNQAQQPGTSAPPDKATPGAVPAAGEVYGNRFDFIPGDKVIVYDDFTDTDLGDYPARWTMKDGGGNAAEIVDIGGRRFLKSRYQKNRQDRSLHWLRYAPNGDMPNKFTLEFDADMGGAFSVAFSNPGSGGGQEVEYGADRAVVVTDNAKGQVPVPEGVQHVSIAVSGTQVKVYVAGERVLIDSDGLKRPIRRLGMLFSATGGGIPYVVGDHEMFTAFRLAEGGKDVKTMLVTGRIVTHGILFDTGSDVIKPESGPTLRNILSLLNDDQSLAFSIEGHTDNQGGAAVNGPLSERRARAVKAWLTEQGVAEKRLTAVGLGDTKPIDTNNTAEGRANNRRVEFARTGHGAT